MLNMCREGVIVAAEIGISLLIGDGRLNLQQVYPGITAAGIPP